MLAGLYVTGVTEMYRESFCVVEHLRLGLMPPLCDCDAKAGQVLPLHKETHGVPHLEAGLPPDMLAKIDQMRPGLTSWRMNYRSWVVACFKSSRH